MCMATCTNVPRMCRKRQAERPVGQGLETSRSDSVRARFFVVQASSAAGAERGAADDLHPPVGKKRHHPTLRQARKQRGSFAAPLATSQTCIRSLIGSSRRGTWNAAWRRSPCGCSQSLRGRWPSNPAEEGWPGDNHPAGEREEKPSPQHIRLQNASADNKIILKMSKSASIQSGMGFGETKNPWIDG